MIQKFIAALQNKDIEQAKSLVREFPILADAQAPNGVPITMMAAYHRNMELFNFLLDHKVGISIFEAIIAGRVEVVSNFIKEEMLLHQTTPDGFSPLGIACFFGQVEIAKLLIEKGANVNQASNNTMKVTPLHSAVTTLNIELVRLLLNHGAAVNAQQDSGVTALHSAAHHGNVEMVKLLLQHGADVHAKMKNGKTPIDFAIEDKFEKVIKLLKEYEKK